MSEARTVEAIAEPAGGDTGDEAFTSETPVEAAEPEHATV